MIDWCMLQNPVAEIENMLPLMPNAIDDVTCRCGDDRGVCEEYHRVKVALQDGMWAEDRPSMVNIATPVYAHDVAAGGSHVGEQPGGVGAEMDDGHLGLLCDGDGLASIGGHIRAIVVRTEFAHPAIK